MSEKAAYDQDLNEVQFNTQSFRIKSNKFLLNRYRNQIETEIGVPLNTYSYCIPISYIYHELIHFVQYQYINYVHTPFLEATNELFVFILTGDEFNTSYQKEMISYWHILHNVLKLKNTALYRSLRDAIIKKDYIYKTLLADKNFLKLLSKKFDNDINKFLFNFPKLKIPNTCSDQCWKELKYLHNIIFYEW